MGGGQVGAVVAEGGIAVIAPLRLHEYHHVAEAQATHRKAGRPRQAGILLRRPPHRLQPLAAWFRQLLVPAPVDRQGQMGEGGTVVAFGVVAAAGEQRAHQRLPIGRQRLRSQVVAVVRQPGKHRGSTGGGVEPHPVGQATVAAGVVGQHQGETLLRRRGGPQACPAGRQLGHPSQPLRLRYQLVQRRGQGIAAAPHFLEAPHPGGEPPIELRQRHLQAEVEGAQPD